MVKSVDCYPSKILRQLVQLVILSIIEAVFGGLAAGKIGGGSYVGGIKHIVIMIVMAVVAFMLI